MARRGGGSAERAGGSFVCLLAGALGASGLNVHDRTDGLPDPLGHSFDFAVAQMSVAQGHADIGVLFGVAV